MAIKYANIFHSQTLQNLPKWDFGFENKPSGNPGSKPQTINILDSTPDYRRTISEFWTG
jgi:hypothetical protein